MMSFQFTAVSPHRADHRKVWRTGRTARSSLGRRSPDPPLEIIMKTEQEIEEIQGRTYLCGQISGIENMALHFKKKSGERFSLGQKQAFEYRIKLKRSCAPTAKADEGGKVK